MPRIRSIKPQFWTSEQITNCSIYARLAFIGLWNFCDDYGVHPASEARLRMEVFPGGDGVTNSDVRSMVDELIKEQLIKEYEVRGAFYWLVTGWDRHQKPDTKTGQYPLPDGEKGKTVRRKVQNNSANEHGGFGQ